MKQSAGLLIVSILIAFAAVILYFAGFSERYVTSIGGIALGMFAGYVLSSQIESSYRRKMSDISKSMDRLIYTTSRLKISDTMKLQELRRELEMARATSEEETEKLIQ